MTTAITTRAGASSAASAQPPSSPAPEAAAESPASRPSAPRMDTACYRDALLSTGVTPEDPGADYAALYG